MAALDLDVLNAIIVTFCPYCTPREYLSELTYRSAHCPPSYQGRDEEHRRIQALAALCLTSKQVGTLATRHLYHRPTATSWPLLARTLIERPDLARRVKHLNTRNWAGIPGMLDNSFPPEVARHWSSKVAYPVEMWDSEDEDSEGEDGKYEDGEEGLSQAGNIALDIVVALCPELEELDAVLDGGDAFALLEPGSLPRLRTVAVVGKWKLFGMCPVELWRLPTAAPNVHTLVGWQIGLSYRQIPLESITHLRLGSSCLQIDSLRHTLMCFPQLESFEFRAGYISAGGVQFTPLEAQEVLAELAPRLKGLVLNFDDAASSFEILGADWVLRSLAGLTELRRLEVDTRCIVPHMNPAQWRGRGMQLDSDPGPVPGVGDGALVELLPESIRELKITRGDRGPEFVKLRAALAGLAAAARQFPALKEVLVEGSLDGADAVKEAFKARGVLLVVPAVMESADDPLA
ncbi:hypothetical protein IMZ48_28150 [Candidatus Bathyarchaeota archaeon]|nr:hypothetical protein [Candidatus Bathyarchaeota archaeon]